MISNRRIATWTRRGLDAALVLLIAICLGTVILARVVPLTGRTTLVVAGGSMAPSIAVGSAVVVDRVVPSSLAVGDVVSLRSGPERATFTHRVIRVVERDGMIWVETKGDANAEPDPSITPAADVVGRVAVAIPGAGYLIALLASPRGVAFVVLLGLVLLLAGAMIESPALGRLRVATGVSGSIDAPASMGEPA